MDHEKGLVLHHVTLADNYNLDKAGDFLTQLHLATGLTEDQVANAEVLKNLNLQDEDATIKQFVFQGQCMILGDSGAGKTSLVNTLTGKPFDPSQTKTRKMEQKLVDEDWKNLALKDLLLGNLWWFRERISVQLTLYRLANSQNIVLRSLTYWRNGFVSSVTELILFYFLLSIVCDPFVSPLVLLLFLYIIVFLYLLNYNHTFRLIVTTVAFTLRFRGLVTGAFLALTLIFYHYEMITLINAYGYLLIALFWGLITSVYILLSVGISWQCPYPRQMKFKYQGSLNIFCFLPILLSVSISMVCVIAGTLLLISYYSGVGRSIKDPDKFVHAIMLPFLLFWTYESFKSTSIYIKLLLKWLGRRVSKVAVAFTSTFLCILVLSRLCYTFERKCFDSTITLIFLCDSLFREWLNMQELGIKGNRFTVVVIEKQELRKEKLKVALHI